MLCTLMHPKGHYLQRYEGVFACSGFLSVFISVFDAFYFSVVWM